MNCSKIYHAIKNGESNEMIEKHIENCASCAELYEKVNHTMAVLDDFNAAPEALLSSILTKKEEIQITKVRRMNFASYIQIAAAVVFGVFIGHQFGKNANPISFRAETDPIDQYLEAHHLTLEETDFKNPSIF